ncbi:MAG: hypothetical protein IH600_09670 [Bacteroidetes bacterium]|nr:hypothetical protein [Bacteroidota bacterium]
MHSHFPLPENPADALFNGISFCRIGAYPAAQMNLEHCLVQEPDNIRARYYLGVTQFRLGQYGAAVRTLNFLARMEDVEARLAAQMLRQTYALAEGNPMFDVQMLHEDVIQAICDDPEPSVLEPEFFARIVWQQPGRLCTFPNTTFELSIVLGPNHHWLCTVPPSQSLLMRKSPLPSIPSWSCSAKVFDRVGAAMLFFQRALYDGREAMARFFTPQICQTSFPKMHEEILLRRIFPEPFEMPLGLFGGLFPIRKGQMRRMIIRTPSEFLGEEAD